MSWKDLDIKQKVELIKLGVQSGIRDINQIRQLYDDNNTPTQVIGQFYNETNVRPLQGIERIKQEYGIPEEEVNKANEIIQQIENEISLEEINNQQPVQFRQFKDGGYKNKPPFEEWYKTVPVDRNDTTYYNLRKAYEELPFDQLERWRTATLEQLNNEQYHLPTVSPQSLEFLKSRNHPSIQHELNWYNSPEGKDFRDKHSLDTTGNYYRYIHNARGGYISNNPIQALVGKVEKYSKGGYKNPDEPPVSESTHVQQSPLNIYEQELLNYLYSNPTAEQEYFRDLAIQNMIAPQSNQGVIQTKEEQDLVDKAFQEYNNFRYSHPWAEGLGYTPIVGDAMDLVSLAGDVNNKNYINAGLGLGMLALPNFIQKPLQKYGKLQNIPDEVWDDLYNKAIKNNNLEEVQQLRDLHFKVKAPETRQRTPMFNASGESTFNEFNGGKTGLNWFSESEKYAANHGVPRAFYINEPNIYFGNVPAWVKGTPVDERYIESLRRLGYGEKQIAQKVQSINEAANSNAPAAKSIGMGANNELVTKNNNTAKLADAITYDDNGKIIPLSKRDNFNNPDIRYSWLIPTIPFGLMSYKLFNQNNKEEYKNEGFLSPNQAFSHKFEDGGYSNSSTTPTIDDKPKVVQKGTVGWNPFNVFNRNYRGAPIYESENFGDSFRQARIDEVPIFIWNGKAYNTNLKPNPLVEAARAWDTQGDLRKIEFQKRIISDPEGTMEYFRKTFPKGEYKTMNSNWDKDIYIIDDMYKNGALGMPNNVIVKGAKHNIGDQLWDYLNTTNLTYNQKLALMANSYKESMGWTTTKQTNGPAKGYYQMENAQFKNYQNWLKQNKLEDNIINETKYIIDLFENHRDKLITPISANLDIEDVINNYKDEEEAHANNHRSAYVHRGYYTEDALRDWDEGDLDAAVKAMEALFEKAGKPRLEDRQKIAWLLSEMYK